MINFASESVKHDFYVKLNAERQLALMSLYKALIAAGYALTVTQVSLEEDGRLSMGIHLREYYK